MELFHSFLLWLSDIPLYIYIYTIRSCGASLSIYLLIDILVVCFYDLAIVNSAALNIGVHVCF